MSRRLGTPGVLLVAAVLLGGCRDRQITEPPPGGTPGPEHVLRPGQLVFGIDSVAVGASDGVLTAPVTISIKRLTAPVPTVPLPAEVRVVGAFYELAASTDVLAPNDDAFILGLPVPRGVSLTNLAIAVLVPREYADGERGTARWSYLIGIQDATLGLQLAALSAIVREPFTVVLVSSDAFAPQPAGAQMAAQHSVARSAADLPDFYVYCGPDFGGGSGLPEPCTGTRIDSARQELQETYRDFTDIGFRAPRLYRKPGAFDRSGPRFVYDAYTMMLRSCTKSLAAPDSSRLRGQYTFATSELWVCLEEGGVTPRVRGTIRHEYFHAVQSAYPAVAANWNTMEQWFREGQASAAERSLETMYRTSDYDPRDPAKSFLYSNEQLLPYEAQDFWVYLGRRLQRGLNYLIPFLERGPTASSVDQTLRQDFRSPEIPDLGNAYWEWAKNQVYEKTFPLDAGSNTLGAPCEANRFVDPQDKIALGDARFDVPPVPLEPLSSKVYEIDFEATDSYSSSITVTSSTSSVRVKYYEKGQSNCKDVPESNEATVDISQGTPKVVYVLISNTDIAYGAEFTLDIVPMLLTVSPRSLESRGDVDRTVRSNFSLTNRGDAPILFATTSSESWLRITRNDSGVLAPGATRQIDLEATCPADPGTYLGTVELEFKNQRGEVLSGRGIPRNLRLRLECSASCPVGPAPNLVSGNSLGGPLSGARDDCPASPVWAGTILYEESVWMDVPLDTVFPCCNGEKTTRVSGVRSEESTVTTVWTILPDAAPVRIWDDVLGNGWTYILPASYTMRLGSRSRFERLTKGWEPCHSYVGNTILRDWSEVTVDERKYSEEGGTWTGSGHVVIFRSIADSTLAISGLGVDLGSGEGGATWSWSTRLESVRLVPPEPGSLVLDCDSERVRQIIADQDIGHRPDNPGVLSPEIYADSTVGGEVRVQDPWHGDWKKRERWSWNLTYGPAPEDGGGHAMAPPPLLESAPDPVAPARGALDFRSERLGSGPRTPCPPDAVGGCGGSTVSRRIGSQAVHAGEPSHPR